jgi:hypothetical protein
MSKKSYDITPDISLMPKLGKSGYSSPQALAELVDNSIDARMDGEVMTINIKIDKNTISIADNGLGMGEKELAKAMTLAYSTKTNQLGEFGLGLKTACNSLGTKFEIISTPKNDSKQYVFIFDQEEWLKGLKKWEIDIESTKSNESDHFTIVKIEKLAKYWPQLAEIVKSDIEKRFAPYIEKGEIVIKVNGKICAPNKFDLIESSKKEFEIEISNGKLKGEKIYGWYGLLKEGSNKGLYGFHTYRRGRMITTYDKIAIGEHPTISRIIGEIHLDFVPVTHNKKDFIKESDEYALAEKLLVEEFKSLLKEARKKSGQDKITKQVISEIDVWKEKISQAILRAPDLKYYTSQIDPKTGMVKDEKGDEEEVPAEKREKGDENGSVEPKNTDKKRMPKTENENRKKIIKVKGTKIEFEHEFASLGQESSWKQYNFDKAKHKLNIYTNIDFPAFTATKDTTFYAVLHIAEAISEVMVKEVGEEISNMQEIKEIILRVASTLKMQIDD